ncbi:hypothetical protein X735_25780 [Mesorhizobium sp. L2C085B000]|uniref:hypothetical protein n=1 Tax=Mesorhizobium sp. L2C085B000 TaxID=1287117 RepID=UPI0003D04387|nr:hypothetical protein [Mesorhizobium sp. L2C085B000]ESZ11465.1 hypothetical protein X735_25780 [Mesorhizobium sp. L2C085B000]
MARPKLGESESKRLQMVITEDELQAIEDWRFANRVQSKSEAIRRLVQIGLHYVANAEPLIEAFLKSRDKLFEWGNEVSDLLDKDYDYDTFRSAAALSLLDNIYVAGDLESEVDKRMRRLVEGANPFLDDSQSIPQAMLEASTYRRMSDEELLQDALKELEKRGSGNG